MTGPSTGGTPALAVTGMSVAYGDVYAVHGATFSIAPGEACAITGPNGNGKSSLLMGIAGLVRRRGDVQIYRAGGLLVLACALIIGSAFWLYIRYTLGGKAMEACGENSLGARIVGIDTPQ